ncbi:MAG: FAD-binding oxidoreductase [Gammaproteobacteria bacterium]
MKVQVKARNRAFEFDGSSNESVLYAGLRTGVALPYECATGTCGTCKAKLIQGDVVDHWPDAPGRKYLKAEQGEFLMCQCSAKTDLSIEVANFISETAPGSVVPDNFTGVVRHSRTLAHDVKTLTVELESPREFDAGQFVAIRFPGIEGYRGYSMVNFERHPKTLEFVIKKLPGGGVSEWLFANDPTGVKLELFGPLGSATFYPGIGKNPLFIAGGSGIAGMMSMLSRGCQEGYFRDHNGYLFFGVRTAGDAFYLDELTAFKAQFPETLHITVAFSAEDVPEDIVSAYPSLDFDAGFVHEVAARKMKGSYDDVIAYLAGPPPAVEAAIRTLVLEARLSADSIRYDKFS